MRHTSSASGTPDGFLSDFRRFFVRGLAALLPTLVTIAILVWAYSFVDRNIGQYITRGMIQMLASTGQDPFFSNAPDDALVYGDPVDEFIVSPAGHYIQQTRQYRALTDAQAPQDLKRYTRWEIAGRKYHLGLVGFVFAILLICTAGYFVATFVGRAIWRFLETGLNRVPVIGTIYPNVKQVTDFLLSDRKFAFSAVVAVEYPRKGAWSVGFVTGPGLRTVADRVGEDCMSVFMPTSPTPFTGYVMVVPRTDIVELPWTIDEALRFMISGGVIQPDREQPADGGQETKSEARLRLTQMPEVVSG